jgi:hypothetical protein
MIAREELKRMAGKYQRMDKKTMSCNIYRCLISCQLLFVYCLRHDRATWIQRGRNPD